VCRTQKELCPEDGKEEGGLPKVVVWVVTKRERKKEGTKNKEKKLNKPGVAVHICNPSTLSTS
jgi:hypothetical protein